jgi:branched-chain amino acid transport system ATP-binding protein
MTTASAAEDAAAPTPATKSSKALRVEELSVRYGGVRAVEGVSFEVEPGESVGIIGANGAGKTSTLRALLALTTRRAASITFGETDLMRTSGRQMVKLGVGYVPEGRHVFAGLTVEKNLLLGAYSQPWNNTTRARLREVYEIFPVLGDMCNRLAGALSGGQQQMLAVGRALMSGPQLLLLDEPSMGLSPKLVDEILVVLLRLRDDGLSILLVEQNAKLTFEATSRCLVMENGSVAMSGSSTDLRSDPQVRKIYLGL